ncbi:hypothetical protein [Neobacillus sp. PS3-40]|uniref:hypothetical protein n=1 Tax=Neobacillus sp. PS3-40 TaxID=3070679 RepID=UPI0027E04692|nr:hypothetical protein [Neobacillus sp. PS3-40]WML45411.1 hypothetical protein RCG20_05780 [Neobacillus sp. PS3-40]
MNDFNFELMIDFIADNEKKSLDERIELLQRLLEQELSRNPLNEYRANIYKSVIKRLKPMRLAHLLGVKY